MCLSYGLVTQCCFYTLPERGKSPLYNSASSFGSRNAVELLRVQKTIALCKRYMDLVGSCSTTFSCYRMLATSVVHSFMG
ncbi:hypothetical protein K443DRAFT_685345 [Laccaria amethystina LaAM-08-1]|uniref:Uncharacterized protein n=1 Tax=Laccaria amethystina LaAM-08-1 TaxID=1095629 RepID=A0A0C9X3Q6_9AGAR|nr:hypothetical protein K443DRAFT_685345 [Laccaria amethystina LaAM-08-1]